MRRSAAVRPAKPPHFMLRLFVTGARPASVRAVRNIRNLCEKHLKGRYTLEIVDLYQHRGGAKKGRIVAAPTLIKELPSPLRKVIGDLSDEKHVLLALDIYRLP